MTIHKIAIIGTGIMGMGIAQIAAQAGVEVLLYDVRIGAAHSAHQTLKQTLEKLTAKGKLTDAQLQSTLNNLIVIDELQQIAEVDAVIEAIIENLQAKQQLFAQLEAIVPASTILATNTSSLSVTAIAAECRHPERVAGFHFFNPVPLMKIVEVIPGLSTSQSVVGDLLDLAKRMGHLGVIAKDTPGFIVNHAGRAYGTEALKLYAEGVASFEAIDRILRDGAGFRMGPFELMDLTGIDVSHPVMESIYNQFYQEDRYRPNALTRQMFIAKKFGRKVGEGFYCYENGVKNAPSRAPLAMSNPSWDINITAITSVWIGADLTEDKQQLSTFLAARHIDIDQAPTPNVNSLVLLATYGEDTTNAALRLGVNPEQAVGIDMLTDLVKHRTLMPSLVTQEKFVGQAYAIFAKGENPSDASTQATLIQESTGFVAQRVLAMVINLGCDMAAQQIATPQDIDNAVKLGLGYPYGPISWGEKIGATRILLILQRIYALTGDQRYRPSPWLQRRAKLGCSLFTQQNNCQ